MTLERHGRSLATSLAAATLLLLAATEASAQEPPVGYLQVNRGLSGFYDGSGVRVRSAERRGVRAGDFIIWPSLILEGRYDSNVYHKSPDDGIGVIDAAILRFLPGVAISNGTPNKLALTLGIEGDIRVYLGEQVEELRNAGVKADLRLDILPKSPVTVTLIDVFRRDLQARNIETSDTFNVNVNNATLQLAIHPGGGALNIITSYGFEIRLYDEFTDADRFAHRFRLGATWRFYPKTAALLDLDFSMHDWQEDADNGLRVDNKPFRAMVGLTGYITKKLSAVAKVGYGNSFHDEGPSFSHVLGEAELAYNITPTILIAAGFIREFRDAFYSNYLTENRTYLRSEFLAWRRLRIAAGASFSLVDYAEFDPQLDNIFISHRERRDQVVTGQLAVSVDITRWIGVSVGYEVDAVFTNFRIEQTSDTGAGLQSIPDAGEYIKHQVYGSVDIRY